MEYNDILCGIRKRIKNAPLNEKQVCDLARFAFEYYLNWTPHDIATKLNKEILQKMKLDKMFYKVLEFPHELDPKKDFFYYAHVLYPDVIPYDVRAQIVGIYREVVDKKRRNYTMNFFNDDYALERAEICLQEALKKKEFRSVKDMYAFFATKNGAQFIEENMLIKPLQLYYKKPVKFLHECLSDDLKSSFWYNYYLFKPQFERKNLLIKKASSVRKNTEEEENKK